MASPSNFDMQKTWVGLAGGGGAAIIGGFSSHLVTFVNCAQPFALQVPCVVAGLRGGLVAHAGANASIAIVTGVHSPSGLDNLDGSGFDFAIDVVTRWGDLTKAGGRVGQFATTLKYIKDTDGLAQWLTSDQGNLAVNALTGDLSLSNKSASFAMISIPFAGTGIGAGAWYEVQKLMTFDNPMAWKHAPVMWRLIEHGGNLWLQAKGLPAQDGEIVDVWIAQSVRGLDGQIRLDPPTASHGGYGHGSWGIARGTKLFESTGYSGPAAPPDGGINLTIRAISEIRGVFSNSRFSHGMKFELSMLMGTKKNKVAWGSHTSVPVTVIERDPDNFYPKWKNNKWEIKSRKPTHDWSI